MQGMDGLMPFPMICVYAVENTPVCWCVTQPRAKF